MKKWILLKGILSDTGIMRYVTGFFGFFLFCSLMAWLLEPGITSFGDGAWYCYAVVTTIGFGDVLVTTRIMRVLSMLLTLEAIVTTALFTGVVVNYFLQVIQLRQKETLTAFLDKLEHLPDMNREELTDLSRRVKEFRMK